MKILEIEHQRYTTTITIDSPKGLNHPFFRDWREYDPTYRLGVPRVLLQVVVTSPAHIETSLDYQVRKFHPTVTRQTILEATGRTPPFEEVHAQLIGLMLTD